MSDTNKTNPTPAAAEGAAAPVRPRKPRLLLVTGPWSSGTSAVAGMLDALGVNGLGPYFNTNDVRTPVSYESTAFRNTILALTSENELQVTANRDQALAALRALRQRVIDGEFGPYDAKNPAPIFLKLPLSALLLSVICQVFDTQLLYVLRPMKDIEATRVRRQWPEHFGAKGAQIIYAQMFKTLVNRRYPTQLLRYPELVSRPRQHARLLARIAGIDATAEQLEKAASFVRRARPAAAPEAAVSPAPSNVAAKGASAKSESKPQASSGKSGKKS